MPSRKATDGEYRDIASDQLCAQRKIQTIILKQYEQAMAEAEAEEAAQRPEQKEERMPQAENGSGYVFRPGRFISKTKMTIYKSISPSL